MSEVTEMLELVAEIHNEFYTADTRIISSYQELKSNRPKVLERAERLKVLGFTRTNEVEVAEEYLQKLAVEEKYVAKLAEFKQRYPLDKFITEAQIKAICEKYSLLFAQVSSYKGSIPEKNLLEIENRKPLAPEDECWVNSYNGWFGHISLLSIGGGKDKLNRFQMEEALKPKEKSESEKESKYKLQSLFICAPKEDMDTRHMAVEDGYKLVPDPIVLEETSSGLWRICSAWGPEANDLVVANPALN